jgi:hypothetical protein
VRQTPKEQYPPRQSLRYVYRLELATLKSEFAQQIRVEDELASQPRLETRKAEQIPVDEEPATPVSRNQGRVTQVPPTVKATHPSPTHGPMSTRNSQAG